MKPTFITRSLYHEGREELGDRFGFLRVLRGLRGSLRVRLKADTTTAGPPESGHYDGRSA